MAEPKMQEIMESIFKNAATDLEKIQPTVSLKLNTSVQNCFKKSGDNPDRFATCMIDTQKKAQELTENFQFKQLFLSHSIQSCLIKNNDQQRCKKDGLNILRNSISSLLKQIEQL